MEKNILEIQNLTKYYGKIRGVENLSLKLEEGGIFGFIGPFVTVTSDYAYFCQHLHTKQRKLLE